MPKVGTTTFVQRLKPLLLSSGLYRPARNAYEVLFQPELRRDRQKMIAFYSRFIKSGDLVFDVGANLGRRSLAFLALGARVVAVEPNPICADEVRAVSRGRNLVLEQAAIGAQPGEAELHLCQTHLMSTLSTEFSKIARERPEFEHLAWERKITVKVETLDRLIDRHGSPVFIKIDVEGYEPQVLQGLRRPVPAVSFEYTPELIGNACDCVNQLASNASYLFNWSRGESFEMNEPAWIDAEQILARLQDPAVASSHSSGDIYAAQSPPAGM